MLYWLPMSLPKGVGNDMEAREAESKTLIHVRLNKKVVKQVDHLSVEWDVYRNEAIERLLRQALEIAQHQGALTL